MTLNPCFIKILIGNIIISCALAGSLHSKTVAPTLTEPASVAAVIEDFVVERDATEVKNIFNHHRATLLPLDGRETFDIDRLLTTHEAVWTRSITRNVTIKVLRQHNSVLGFVAYAPKEGTEALITFLAVADGYQRQGLGSALLHAAITDLHEQKYTCIRLVTRPTNHAGIACYHRHGFHEKMRVADSALFILEKRSDYKPLLTRINTVKKVATKQAVPSGSTDPSLFLHLRLTAYLAEGCRAVAQEEARRST